MASLGVVDVDALEELGRGTYAVAYRLPDGRVLKVTADSRSARAAKVVLEAGPAPGIVHVYEVKQLPGGAPFWATVEEYVLDAEHLHDDVRSDLDAAVEAVQWLLDREWLRKLRAAGASRDAAERIIRQFASVPPLWENEAQAVRWLMDIATGLSWLRDHGVRGMSDFHEHNVGIREDGSAVIFDLSSDRIRSSGEIDVAANPAPFDVREVFVALGRPHEVPSMEALAKGIEVEMEHTDDPVLAGKIALDHFREFSDYYERLEVMEERAKKGLPPNPKLVNNSSKMSRVVAAFDRCFEIVRVQFPDFGEIELHQDEKAAADNGHGSERQFGYCMDGDPIRIAFARKAEDLPEANINGLVAHEFGHALDNRYGDDLPALLGCTLPRGAERRADAIAKKVFGKTIKYDNYDIQCVACRGESPRPRRLGA